MRSTEQVSKYHPDKYADQISDAILDACLKQDKNSRVACECMVKDYTVVLGGEVTTSAQVDYTAVVKRVALKLGYKVNDIINLIGKQSPEICRAVDSVETLGAGDQGIMFGYATLETKSMLPYGFDIANKIIERIESNSGGVLKGDAKTQVTVDEKTNQVIQAVVSVCHIPEISRSELEFYVKDILNMDIPLVVNPAGKWTVGGPIADCGLTGRKIVCDQYGGYVPVGGGAFSGKDPTKVDRSAAYMARHIAKKVVQRYGIKECLVQLGYVIGQTEPISVDCGNAPMTDWIKNNFDLRPKAIIDYLDLSVLNYEQLSEGCHFRTPIF